MTQTKEELRDEALAHRERINLNEEDMESAVNFFFESINPASDQIIAGYWPKGKEFDSRYILQDLLKKGSQCALPVVDKNDLVLRFMRWEENDALEEGPYGISQPIVSDDSEWVEPDILLVPLLAFDRHGYRLGFGGGYYDATLADLRSKKDIVAVGLGYGIQVCLFPLPIEDHDQKLDWVITPQQVFNFTGEEST